METQDTQAQKEDSVIRCPLCDEESIFLKEGNVSCKKCGNKFDAYLFPFTRKVVLTTEAIENTDDASCAFHGGNAAVSVCARCGTFICSLCEITHSGEIFCPLCYERSGKNSSRNNSEFSHRAVLRTLVMAGFIPSFGFLSGFVLAIYGMGLIIKFWNTTTLGEKGYVIKSILIGNLLHWGFVLAVVIKSILEKL